MSDIVISGYYGLGNSGDEALLKSIVEDLRSINPRITITALSADKKSTNKSYNIKTINRYNLFSYIKEIKRAKLLISGGGTLIQDATSTKSLLYYLLIIKIAKMFNTKVMLYANGMGPIKESNRKIVKKVLDGVELITLRETDSLIEIKNCNIQGPQIKITADPAFNLKCADNKKVFTELNIPEDKKIIVVSVREWAKNKENFETEMANALDVLCKKGYYPVLMPMQKECDLSISKRVLANMKNKATVIEKEISVEEMLYLIGKSTIACGMRLHMLIFASVMNIPMVGIVYDPKVKGFMKYMKQENYVELEKFSSDYFVKIILNCIDNIDKIKEEIKETSDALRVLAKTNAQYAIELLEGDI